MVEKTEAPLVSIVMPVYNASRFVEAAAASVLGQTYRNIELLAVDDGSTDNSLELLKSFNDPRMRVIEQMNQGAGVARNRGLQESRGKYIY
jgi:glycosyltransferase involved in cell wall biosynthesis